MLPLLSLGYILSATLVIIAYMSAFSRAQYHVRLVALIATTVAHDWEWLTRAAYRSCCKRR